MWPRDRPVAASWRQPQCMAERACSRGVQVGRAQPQPRSPRPLSSPLVLELSSVECLHQGFSSRLRFLKPGG